MKIYVLVLPFAVASSMAQAATVQQFDLPGYVTTCGTAISSNGAVAGIAYQGPLFGATAFVYKNGKFSYPKTGLPPGAVYISGINRWGDVVGFDTTNDYNLLWFEYAARSTTLVSLQSVDGITDSGTILGEEFSTTSPTPYYQVGVVIHPHGARTILDDGTGYVQPTGMDSAAGRVVGTSYGANGVHAWSHHDGVFTTLAFPGATAGTLPSGVNTHGVVIGTYYAGPVENPVSHGFFFSNGRYTSWDVPGAISTQMEGMNESGQFTGCFTDSANVTHGFIATP
jgi:hypothetical protein